MRLLFLLFIAIPIVEMWVLIEVGSKIGALSTIALVFLTAAIGLALLRQQGLKTLLRVNQRMEQGQLPAGEILEGVMLAVGGALLLTPGFITDAIGFACLLPPGRQLIVAALLKQGIVMASYGRNSGFGATFEHGGSGITGQSLGHGHIRSADADTDTLKNRSTGEVLDGDFHRDD